MTIDRQSYKNTHAHSIHSTFTPVKSIEPEVLLTQNNFIPLMIRMIKQKSTVQCRRVASALVCIACHGKSPRIGMMYSIGHGEVKAL